MKKQFLSKVIFSIALLGNLSIMTSQADYDWLMTDPQGKQWLLDQPYVIKKSLFHITKANRDSLSTGARTIGPDLELPSLSTGGGASAPAPAPAPAPQVPVTPQVPGGGAGSGTGGGGAAAFPSAADVQKFAQCIRIAGELLESYPALGGDFAALDITNPGLSVVTITDNNVTTAIGASRKSYNLGTLGKQPADHGKKGKRAAMTPAEKKRHKDLADRKNGRHNKVMQDKKAPHKKAAARGGKKAGNVKAQAMNNQHRKVS